jgi:ATP/ADP translocase/HEAT repeat protein
MIRRLREFIPVRPGEYGATALMFACHFGVMAFYYILDPLRPALFVTNVGSDLLPYAYLLTAVVAGAIATIMFKAGQRWSIATMITGVSVAVIAALFYFRSTMAPGSRELWYLPWIFYVFMKIVPALATAQFWILAGYVFDSRQAKRLYRILILGAGLGALAGSYVPAFLSGTVSVPAMLMICVAIWLVLIALAQFVWRRRRAGSEAKPAASQREEPQERFADLWKMVFASRHLATLSALVFLMFIVSNIADWQINTAAQLHYQDLATKAERSAKIGELFGRVSLTANALSLTFQLLITGFVVRRLGIRATILFLPACLFLSSLGLALFPTYLLGAVFVRISDWAPRYSLDKTGRELLYLPLTPAVRKRLKVFIDVFVDRAGRAAAAPLILGCIALGLGLRGTAIIALVLTLTCLVICLSLANTYVNAFREQLKRREVDFGGFESYLSDPASVQLLVGALAGNNERQILYSLQLLHSVRGVDFSPQLLPLLSHKTPYIREAAAGALQALPRDCAAEAEQLLTDPSDAVRLEAINYLCSHDPATARQRAESLLNHPDLNIRLDAARWASEHAGPDVDVQEAFVRGLMAAGGSRTADAGVAAAGLALRLPRAQAGELLRQLLSDPSEQVSAAAARAAGKGGFHDLLFPILNMLTSGKSREAARSALLAYGERILGALGDVLADSGTDVKLRCEIPWVLGRIATVRAAGILLENLGAGDSLVRFRVVEALGRLHEDHPEIPLSFAVALSNIDAAVRSYYERRAARLALESAGTPGRYTLLTRSLQERLSQDLDIIFRLLELRYAQKEMRQAYAALTGNRSDRRTAAIELLDNVLSASHKATILPLLEESSAARFAEQAKTRFGIEALDPEAAIDLLARRGDAWLRACALHEIGEHRVRGLTGACEAGIQDPNPWVRETAVWALERVNPRYKEAARQ